MSQILKAQIAKLMTTYPSKVDGIENAPLTDSTNEISFIKASSASLMQEVKVTFADYFIYGFPGFNFHDKFNQSIAPPNKVMYGIIIKSTEKMFYLQLHDTENQTWTGWCPRKSCTIEVR